MDNFNLNNIPNTNFVFDFKTPTGYLPFGYTKHTIGLNILNKLKSNDAPYTGYYASKNEPSNYKLIDSAGFSTYVVERTPNTKFVLTSEIKDNINKDELYLIVIESLNFSNLFEYYSEDFINFEELLSPELLKLLKKYPNIKLAFVDWREGSYDHNIYFLSKINNFLNKHNIIHKNKVIITTNNNFITKIKFNR
jgi:hypothetical protein